MASLSYPVIQIPREGDELRKQIRARGLRATPARVAILRLMRSANVALSHAEVIDALGTSARDRATTHRVLVQLANARLLRRIDIGDHVWRFVAERDGPDEPSAEFVCETCGALERLDAPKLSVSGHVPRSVANGTIEIRILGRCDNCTA